MTEGTSQGLFIVVAIVIFGIFTLLAYILFEDTLSPALANMFEDALESSQIRLTEDYTGKNLLLNGDLERIGPEVGFSGVVGNGKIEGVEGKEFVQYADVTKIFDKFGIGLYTISFDIKANNPGSIHIYTNTGASKYRLAANVTATAEWERKSVVVTVHNIDSKELGYNPNHTRLSFYGTYGTGVSPSIKNVKIELGSVQGVPDYDDAPITLKY